MQDFVYEQDLTLSHLTTERHYNHKETEFLGTILAEYPKVITHDNISSFAEMVGNKGCSFCPATFTDKAMSKETYEQSQLLPLYFDSKYTSFTEIKAKADNYDLPILLAYDTFSVGSNMKLTVVFLNDVSITHMKVAEIMSEALLTIFPEADQKSSNVINIFHGGNRLLYFNESITTINTYSLMMNMCLCLKDRYGDNHKRNVYEFSTRTGLGLNNKNMLDISVIEFHESLESMKVVDHEDLPPNSNIYNREW